MTTTRDNTEAAIWERVIHPQGKMTVTAARQIVQLEFTDEERARMHELAEKNQSGTLSSEEASELDNYCRVDCRTQVPTARTVGIFCVNLKLHAHSPFTGASFSASRLYHRTCDKSRSF